MDLEAVKAAPTPVLASCAVGAAVNAQCLLDDAQLLSAAGRHARAFALAALAVEEAGKAGDLVILAVMPAGLRAQAPVGRMLEWHQLKMVGGLLITAMPIGTVADQLAAMSASRIAGILEDAQVLAQDADDLKQRGLYADIDRSGQVRLPSEVTETDVATQLGRAQLAVSSAAPLLAPGMAARIANPPAEAIELCRAMVTAFADSGSARTPRAAADVLRKTASKLQDQTAASDARPPTHRQRPRN